MRKQQVIAVCDWNKAAGMRDEELERQPKAN